MDFDFSEEQTLLKQTVDRFVADRYGFEARKAILKSAGGWSRSVWRELADLGLRRKQLLDARELVAD